MSITVEMPAQEIAALKELTRLDNDAEAVIQAAREFLRHSRLRELKGVSGKVDLLTAGTAGNGRTEAAPAVAKTLPLIKVRPAIPADAGPLTPQEWSDWIKDADLRVEVEVCEKARSNSL